MEDDLLLLASTLSLPSLGRGVGCNTASARCLSSRGFAAVLDGVELLVLYETLLALSCMINVDLAYLHSVLGLLLRRELLVF